MPEHDQGSDDQYVIDTSSLVEIRNHENLEKIWKLIFKLIDRGRLKTVARVMEELKDVDPQAYEKVKPHSRSFVVRSSADVLIEAGRLTRRYPQTCRARGTHPGPADPYVIALAKLNGHIVVTDEGLKRRKIPKICDKEGVTRKNLKELIRDELEE